jgi:intron-binding protein aquarius
LTRRCSWHPLFKRPILSTVDQFQGQQADYVLLSLVRTKNVGHIRDIRRLVVALSRSRLGLYVFCRTNLYKNCKELSPAFSQLLNRPTQLCIAPVEKYAGFTRKTQDSPEKSTVVKIKNVVEMGEKVHGMTVAEVERLRKNL